MQSCAAADPITMTFAISSHFTPIYSTVGGIVLSLSTMFFLITTGNLLGFSGVMKGIITKDSGFLWKTAIGKFIFIMMSNKAQSGRRVIFVSVCARAPNLLCKT